MRHKIEVLLGVFEHGEPNVVDTNSGRSYQSKMKTMFPGVSLNYRWLETTSPDTLTSGSFTIWLERES